PTFGNPTIPAVKAMCFSSPFKNSIIAIIAENKRKSLPMSKLLWDNVAFYQNDVKPMDSSKA
ncbi:hypothetical protein ACMZ6Y_08470, partial [Streptococcus pluranimalium]